MPNPAGQNRRLVRTAIAQWLVAQRIRGLDHVYRSEPPEYTFELYRTGTADYSCLVAVCLTEDSEDRVAFTGPTSPGGLIVHYNAQLFIKHRSYTPGELDWAEDEDDYDRIYDALKDCLRASGRALGRPDVVLQAGEWPRLRGKVGRHDPPVLVDDGACDRWGTLTFTVTQYLP